MGLRWLQGKGDQDEATKQRRRRRPHQVQPEAQPGNVADAFMLGLHLVLRLGWDDESVLGEEEEEGTGVGHGDSKVEEVVHVDPAAVELMLEGLCKGMFQRW